MKDRRERLPLALLAVSTIVAGCVGSGPSVRPVLTSAAGTPAASVTASASPAPEATPIGRESLRGTIVYSSETDGSDDVFLLSLDGGEPVRLTDDPEKEFDPDISPDGLRIAYRRNPREGSDEADIWVMNVDGSDKRNLTNAPEFSNWAPAWMPDERIAYSSMRGGGGALELWSMNADGSDARRLSEGWCEYAKPSPDGTQFVCASAVGGAYDIFVVAAATGERRSLTSTPLTEFGPSWSPDGRWIVFSRDNAGMWTLLRVRSDGSDERRIADEGVFATWDPDGHLVWTGPGGINVANADGSGLIALDYPANFISWAP